MTVKELIEKLQQENPEALVYTIDNDNEIAYLVTEINRNVLSGSAETVVIH